MVILRATLILRGQKEDKGMICSIPPVILIKSSSKKYILQTNLNGEFFSCGKNDNFIIHATTIAFTTVTLYLTSFAKYRENLKKIIKNSCNNFPINSLNIRYSTTMLANI
jgi:hypothetical protein